MKMKEAERYTVRGGLLATALSLVVILYSLTGAVANADTIDVNSTQSVTQINSTIANSSPGDTINFTSGTYNQQPSEDAYILKPNRDYTFNDATINGSGIEDYRIFRIIDGGNINLTGNLTLQNAKDGFYIGGTAFDNINIGGKGNTINFNVKRHGIWMDNIEHASPLTSAAINVSYCIADGGETMIKFDEMAGTTTAKSPYASATNNTAKDLTSRFMDVPKYHDGTDFIMLGEDEIYSNILINMPELCLNTNYQYFNSPSDIGWENVTHTNWGGTGNIELTEADFYDYENLVPLIGSNADGKGAIPAAPEPTMLSLLVLGGLALLRRKRK